jgi:hypothetical protein
MDSTGARKGRFRWLTLLSVALAVALLTAAFPTRSDAATSAPSPRKEKAAGTVSQNKALKGRQRAAMMRLNRAAANASARIAESGVQCEQEEPSAAVQACVGKNAGDACTVTHDEHSFTGTCATTPRGVLACQPPILPPPPPSAVAACENKMAGDECQLTIRDDDEDDEGEDEDGLQSVQHEGDDDGHTVSGICRSFASGVVACVPISMPLQRLIDACEGIEAGNACTFMHDDETVNGTCTAIDALGGLVICVPQARIPPRVAACEGKSSGDECSFTRDGETIDGNCAPALLDQDILVCQPPPPMIINSCSDKNAGDACTFMHDDDTVNGLCVALPFLGNMLVCVPERLIPPSVIACEDKNAGDACSFIRDGRTLEGNCATLPGHSLLACQPPPPQVLIDACAGKAEGDSCSVTFHDRTFTGACGTAPDGVTLACMPQREHEQSPRVEACVGKEAGAPCSVNRDDEGDDEEGDDDGDDDGDAKQGICRPNDEGVLACLPPAPPQEAIDACAGLMVGDMCSFPWGDQVLSGACRALPDGATLVCAPLCPQRQSGQR